MNKIKAKIKYSDGNDYSDLKPNADKISPDHDECVNCGESGNITITDNADICHDCGYVYT